MKLCTFTLALTALSRLFVATAASSNTEEDLYYRASYLDEPTGGGHVSRDMETARLMLARAFLEHELDDLASRYDSAIQAYERSLDTRDTPHTGPNPTFFPRAEILFTITPNKISGGLKGLMESKPPKCEISLGSGETVKALKAKVATWYSQELQKGISSTMFNLECTDHPLADGWVLSGLPCTRTGKGMSVDLKWLK